MQNEIKNSKNFTNLHLSSDKYIYKRSIVVASEKYMIFEIAKTYKDNICFDFRAITKTFWKKANSKQFINIIRAIEYKSCHETSMYPFFKHPDKN